MVVEKFWHNNSGDDYPLVQDNVRVIIERYTYRYIWPATAVQCVNSRIILSGCIKSVEFGFSYQNDWDWFCNITLSSWFL